MYKVLTEVMVMEKAQAKVLDNGIVIVEGIFQKGDEPNANKRIYPMEYLSREVDRLLPLVQARALVGELDHPFYPDPNEASIIHAQHSSHVIGKLWTEGNIVMGRAEALDTPTGKILQEFIKKKVQIGVSSRSLGDVRDGINGFQYVDESLKVITWDMVIGPSVVESKMAAVSAMNEWKVFKETEQRVKQKLSENIAKQVAPKEEEDPEYISKVIREVMNKEFNLPKKL